MGIWFRSAALQPGETVAFKAAANHLPNRRSIGGQVTVTDRRLLFVPNRLDALTGGRTIDLARGDISDVRVLQPGVRALASRGLATLLRPHVAIDWRGNTTVLVVSDREALLAALAVTST